MPRFLSPPGEKSTFETVHGPRSAEIRGYEAGEILIVIREKYLGTGLIFFISRGRKLYVFLKIYNRIPGSRNQRYAFIQFIRDRKFYVFEV